MQRSEQGPRARWFGSSEKAATLVVLLLAMLLGASSFLSAQSSNAQVTGVVSDATGASVDAATVTATNLATGVTYTNTSNSSGVYFLAQLVPGPYEIAVTKDGFGTVKRSNLTVHLADRINLNFSLKPASVQQSVTVTDQESLLQADTPNASIVLDNKMITELPQLNRNSLDLTSVIPGVQGQGPLSNNVQSLGNAAYLIANNGNSYAISGGQVNGTSISVDGNQIQDSEFNATNRAVPTPDSIGEFRVESGVLSADRGRYSGGIITISTKSGTNQLHGRAFEYFRNQILNANTWQNGSLGQARQAFHQNNYGVSLGGPVSIPHLYDGKSRTFFYFGWEGERYISGQTVVSTVPTAEQRNGDFSKTVLGFDANGAPNTYAALFDPYSISGGVRPQYGSVSGAPVGANGLSGGKICSQADISGGSCPAGSVGLSQQSTLFAHYMALYPDANHQAGPNGYSGNRVDSIKATRPTDRFFFRLDENLSNSQRINLSVSRSRMRNSIPAPFAHAARSVTEDHNITGSIQYSLVLSPTSIIDAHLGFGVAKLYSDGVSGNGSDPDPNIDITQWGFDPLIINNPSRTTNHIPPVLNLPGFSNVGGSEFDTFINQTTNGSVSFTKVLGRHTLKVGYEQYFLKFNEHGGDHTGVAWVNPGGGSVRDWTNPGDASTGFALAELMMGSSHAFQWGNWNISPYGKNESAFVMDDWKVNKKLTVQLGLRWDHDGGRGFKGYSKPGQSSGIQYDINAKNVLTPNAGWDWSQVKAVVPALASLPNPAWLSQGATGRVALLDTPEYPQKHLYNTNWKNFQPRFGLSYAIDPNTVLHASAGIIYQGLNGLSTDWFSFYYNTDTFGQISTLDGQNWVSELGQDHGLGTFPLQGNGTNLGYFPAIRTNQEYGFQTFGQAANPDQGGAATLGKFDSPEDYTWDVSFQRQIGRSWVASVDYTGIRGIHLLMPVWGWSLNNIPLSYYQLGSSLQTQVPNPFFGQSQTFASQPTVSLFQLLGLSPQYAGPNLGVTPGQATWGKSMSNFLNFQLQTRSYHGLTLLGSFTYRRTLTNTAGKDIQHGGPAGRGLLQDPHNLMEAYGLATYESPRTLLLNYSYELPFGRGRHYMSGDNTLGQKVLDKVVGGWNFAGVTTWSPAGAPVLTPQIQVHPDGSGAQTAPGAALRYSLNAGTPIAASGDYSSALVDANGQFVHGTPSSHPSVLNRGAFADTPNFGFSNAPFLLTGIRNPGSFFTDATLLKKFYFASEDSKYLEIRLEAQNILNHPNFGNIDPNPNSATFGGVLGKGNNAPRTMQVGLRLFF